MDDQVKARLIGATVLVVIAVALVPELLSGRKADVGAPVEGDGQRGTRTITIDLGDAVARGSRPGPAPAVEPARAPPRLPTVEAPGARAATGEDAIDELAATPATVPGKVAKNEAVASPPARAAPARSDAAGPAAPAVREPSPAPVRKGGWAVQVGAFGSTSSARKLVADLQTGGYEAYVAPLSRNGKTLHRVRVGPEPSRADAEKTAARLKSRGLPAAVVAAD
jgi:DedD protein